MTRKRTRKAASMALILALLLSITVPAFAAGPTFKDVSTSHWAYDYIERCYDEGIVVGIGNDLFDPSATLTYAQFYVMMVRTFFPEQLALEQQEGDNWYRAHARLLDKLAYLARTDDAPEIDMSDAGLCTGIPRYEMALLMYNIAIRSGADKALTGTSKPTDENSIPDWYKKQVDWCYDKGLLKGYEDLAFHGDNTVTRAEACTVICRLEDFLAGKLNNDQPDTGVSETPVPGTEPTTPPVAETKVRDMDREEANAAISDEMFRLINEWRIENGLEAIPAHQLLGIGANIRAAELDELFEHHRPDGRSMITVYEELAGGAWMPGENICRGGSSASDTVHSVAERMVVAWKESPGHNRCLLMDDAIYMGTGVYYADGMYYTVVHISSDSRYQAFLRNQEKAVGGI